MEAAFLPGIQLAGRYYAEVVRPLLDRHSPGLAHSAALIGPGSDVLGFDSPRSTDHNWGPRCQVFVGPGDAGRTADISAMLTAKLPETFLGWPTCFPDVTAAGFPVRHWVEVAELGGWLAGQLWFDPRAGVGLLDWLGTPTQVLAEITGGAVFHDGLGSALSTGRGDRPKDRRGIGLSTGQGDGPTDRRGAGLSTGQGGGLDAVRGALAWYPADVWRHVLACQWTRISQEEAFPGRCAEAGDQLGSAVVAARLVRDVMRLALLMRRRYPPYSKWLGTAFSRLPGIPAVLQPSLSGALSAGSWQNRERELCAAYEAAGRMHNDTKLTAPVEAVTSLFYDRPYRVIDAGRFVAALRDSTTDAEIRRLPLTGAVDQFIDSTDAAGEPGLLRAAVAAQLARPS